MILEADDVVWRGIEVRPTSQGADIRIAGLAFHSALVVQRVDWRETGDSILVLIYMAPTSPGKSGAFDLKFSAHHPVSRIIFGNKQKPIWSKSAER